MCGIAGIWNLKGAPVERPAIVRFVASLAHRGPDGEGVLIDDGGSLALAHRRLAILDLSAAANQPMESLSGRYVITYNGEVYNFLELRQELERSGFRFSSDTDTEVVLAAFEKWGAECLSRFNGMWSFAIWDRKRRSLFVCRDRFGVKPLYFAATASRFAFASETKAFRNLTGFEAAADTRAVAARLAGNFSEHLLLRGVEALAPGSCVEITPERIRRWRWWNTLDHLTWVPDDFAKQADEFRELLFDSCRLRLRCDVPVGTSLSGGLDSSSVICALSEARKRLGSERQAIEWRRAFIAGFAGTMQDEARHAELAARRAGAKTVVRQFSSEVLHRHIDAYLEQFEEIGGLPGMAAWALYREMRREGVVVSMDGHGGDELLGGYGFHVMLALMRGGGLLASPARTLDLIDTLHRMHPAGDPDRPAATPALAALTIPGVRRLARLLPFARRRLNDLDQLMERHSSAASGSADAAEERAIDELGPLTGALYRSFHRQSLPRILRNFDVHSMGHGVEVRMPLLDWRVVCYGFSVPDESKVAGGYSKRLLREAMKGVLPEEVRLRRDKLGFNAPVAHWLNHGLGDWVWDEVNDPEFVRGELWDGRALQAVARSKREPGAAWTPAEAHRVTLTVTAHRWLTRWLRSGNSGTQVRASAG
jgi:asparagine synthase (glutamine-hydrolysing)